MQNIPARHLHLDLAGYMKRLNRKLQRLVSTGLMSYITLLPGPQTIGQTHSLVIGVDGLDPYVSILSAIRDRFDFVNEN